MDPFPFDDYAYLDFYFKDLEIVSYVRDVKFGVMDLLGNFYLKQCEQLNLNIAYYIFSFIWWTCWIVSWIQFDKCSRDALLYCENYISHRDYIFWVAEKEENIASKGRRADSVGCYYLLSLIYSFRANGC